MYRVGAAGATPTSCNKHEFHIFNVYNCLAKQSSYSYEKIFQILNVRQSYGQIGKLLKAITNFHFKNQYLIVKTIIVIVRGKINMFGACRLQ